jgi:hypothetical protein
MRLACNAPPSLWDKFCTTAAYLTNLTATPTLKGKTPYELWYGRRPSLSHLREIGCRAFTLIQTNNPKIYRRSTPCVLIGYAPSSKAYRLWDITTGKIFNSFHVTFIEHLNSLPSSLLPGTTIELAPSASPSWDAASLIPPMSPSPSPPDHSVSPSPPPLHPPKPPFSTSAPSDVPLSSTIPLITITDMSPNASVAVPSRTLHPSQNILTPSLPPSISTLDASQNIPTPSPLPSNSSLPSQNITTSPDHPSLSHNLTSSQNLTPSLDSPTSHPSSSSILPPAVPCPDSPPPLRQSSQLHFPTSCDATRDGLLPDSRLAAAISAVAASSACT